MGKHDKKTGKGRLDKFYKLAKEQGYRARSAFKLIHLNRKYDLLAKSKCTIDLCAAPGGWLQVAEKYMPKGSLIIGVDLHPIRALPHVTTFVSDITTPQCRNLLRSHMHDWKADLVLHDGAPNVGSAWVQDAFTQNELVLQSLKLATEFLVKGGNFVTKVFRSQDYNSLLWVFGQLFDSVEATKPPSSRNVSAEIFVVCQGFIAPKHIDPKFLDPKHVFKDVAALPTSITQSTGEGSTTAASSSKPAVNNQAHANVFMPEKNRRHRDGYAEGDYTLFHKTTVGDFVKGADPVALLGSMNQIEFVTEEEKGWLKSRHTTPDVLANFADLKVLGKGDFKLLMKWRTAIRLQTGLDVKADATKDLTEEVNIQPMDEEEQISAELERLRESKLSQTKREKKRANEKKAKELLKHQLHMTVPTDLDFDDPTLGGEQVFDLGEGEKELSRRGRKSTLGETLKDADGMSSSDSESENEEEDAEVLSSDEERERRTEALEGELDGMYDEYQERMKERDARWKVKQARLRDKNFAAWHGIKEGSDAERGEGDGEESEEGGWDVVTARKEKYDVDSDDSSDEEKMSGIQTHEKKRKAVRFDTGQKTVQKNQGLVTSLREKEEKAQMSRQAQLWFTQSVFKDVGDLAALDGVEEEEEEEDEEMSEELSSAEDEEGSDVEMASVSDEQDGEKQEEEEEDDFEIVPQDKDDGQAWDVDNEDQDEVKQKVIKDKGLLSAEAITLATRLINRQQTLSSLIDDGFNRHSNLNKDSLPTWFLDDEAKHYRPNIPITKEAVSVLRERQRALDARPIKKVAEAKARKKYRAIARLEKAKKKADGVMDTDDLNDNEKAKQVGKLLNRAKGKDKKKEKKIVVAKGSNKGIKGRPKGVKGKYKIVDSRMRKEVRAEKRIKKAGKKRR
ncbi:AdoMet-dependent rRNA methyltransferase SPB1 [Tremella mesenterica]|uniref:AdoMet-dependent rRNA methyltransferase SPB1 n=1 Tax=Tremella mesenterica TaxID=5217 RepID=A0A4Q1BDS4_TREME|nr:AdoMet-dependent rRNA methyltransferase SPB1 [Tremella mesenterica]